MTALTPASHTISWWCFWLVNFFKHDLIAESKQENFLISDKSWQTFISVYQFGNYRFYPCSILTDKTDHTSSQSGLMNQVWPIWEMSSVRLSLFLPNSTITHKKEITSKKDLIFRRSKGTEKCLYLNQSEHTQDCY